MRIAAWKQPGPLLLALWLFWVPTAWAQRPVEVQNVVASPIPGGFQIEVLGSGPLRPETRMLSTPDCIVVDLIGIILIRSK